MRIRTINPKSISLYELYGKLDENTNEWTDGVLALTVRSCAQDTTPDLKWVLFDGPVDSVWVENMNTVLDDNKKLCLNSGEIIKLPPQVTMMFETEDLDQASPATVSRCGMVYLEPDQLGWRPLVSSWVATSLPAGATMPDEDGRPSKTPEFVLGLFEWIAPPLLALTYRRLTQPMPLTAPALIASALSLFQAMLEEEFAETAVATATVVSPTYGAMQSKSRAQLQQEERMLQGRIESVLVFSLIWSIGASIDANSRITFDAALRRLLLG